MVEPGRQIFPAAARESFEAWEVAAVPLPLWLPVEGRRARAWLAVCLDVEEDRTLASEPGEESEIPRMLEQVLARASRKWRARPSRVRVADVELARIVEGLLGGQEVPVEVGRLLVLTDYSNALVADLVPPDPRPSPLTGAGVTVARLKSFARAAADFYASPCWRHLSNEDLIQVEAPEVEEGLRYLSVHYQTLPQQASRLSGLWFFPNLEMFDLMMEGDVEGLVSGPWGFWTLGFDRPWTAPPEDIDLWERHDLPWSGGDRCPVACFTESGRLERPDARQLAFLEGVLAALAATSEEDLDTGRWEKQVSTAEGSVRFVLSLPEVLEPLEGEEDEEDTPQQKAMDLVATAHHLARGRRAVLLARQALEIWPDCAEAYTLLGMHAHDPETALGFYAQAMAAAERAMGPGMFEHAGHFWGLLETRPYMGARLSYAETLLNLGRLEEGAGHLRELLRLNPNDNQGVRESLANVLITLDLDEEAQDLLDRYGEDESALMEFPRALLRFRREGDSVEARRSLKQAIQANRFVPGLLLRTRTMPTSALGLYSPGTEGEAAIYVSLARGTWEKTPGALDWLRERTSGVVRAKAAVKRKKKRRR